MRISVVLDDALLQKAETLTGLGDRSALISAALELLVERESSRRLAQLGGTEKLVGAPRRRGAASA